MQVIDVEEHSFCLNAIFGCNIYGAHWARIEFKFFEELPQE